MASLTTIDFESDPSGPVPNGFIANPARRLSPSATRLPNLEIGDFGTASMGQGLLVGDGPGEGSLLLMNFSSIVDFLSVDFGNDQPDVVKQGNEVILTAYLDGVYVGETNVIMNGDGVMNQSIAFSARCSTARRSTSTLACSAPRRSWTTSHSIRSPAQERASCSCWALARCTFAEARVTTTPTRTGHAGGLGNSFGSSLSFCSRYSMERSSCGSPGRPVGGRQFDLDVERNALVLDRPATLGLPPGKFGLRGEAAIDEELVASDSYDAAPGAVPISGPSPSMRNEAGKCRHRCRRAGR